MKALVTFIFPDGAIRKRELDLNHDITFEHHYWYDYSYTNLKDKVWLINPIYLNSDSIEYVVVEMSYDKQTVWLEEYHG